MMLVGVGPPDDPPAVIFRKAVPFPPGAVPYESTIELQSVGADIIRPLAVIFRDVLPNAPQALFLLLVQKK